MLKFTQSHEWARLEGDYATIGISDYAQKELGDIVFVELPKIGSTVKQNQRFGTIESTKAASELYAPLNGTVSELNKDLAKNPQWINEDAFGKGWMIKIEIADSNEMNNLMDEAQYKEFIAKESH
jgi:glycine cleavage system H protein